MAARIQSWLPFAFHKYSMDINELRDKWQDFLAATLSAKYWKSDSTEKDMLEKLKSFDEFWEKYKNEHQSRDRERHSGETENPGI